MLAYAEKVAIHACQVTPDAIETLRGHGFSDGEIYDIAMAAAARNMYSKLLDGVGAEPEGQYLRLEPGLLAELTVGRPLGGVGKGAE